MSAEFYSTLPSKLADPLGQRGGQDHQGITMIIDKGLGLRMFEDLLETAGSYIDFIKLGFGTTALYPDQILLSKIRLAKKHGITVYPGGTFFEVACHQKNLDDYFRTMKEIGFEKVEISDGTIELSEQNRELAIRTAREYGFQVITEYGKKAAGSTVEVDCLLQTVAKDIEAGADFVIIEGRESGENVGIYDANGRMLDIFPILMEKITPYADRIIWEAPKKNQQVELIHCFGPNVHLGNVAPADIFSVESLRRGLRSDTFFTQAKE